jgi:hydrogenase maturation protease
LSATLVGVGNDWRGDDGAGLALARRLHGELAGVRVLETRCDPAALLDAWSGADHVLVVDAVRSGAEPGTIHRIADGPLPAGMRGSTHALGLAEAVELSRALGRLPARLEIYGIEGARFEPGAGLTPPVARAVQTLCADLRERLATLT